MAAVSDQDSAELGERVMVAEQSIMAVEKIEAIRLVRGCTKVVLSGDKKLRNHVCMVRNSIRVDGNDT